MASPTPQTSTTQANAAGTSYPGTVPASVVAGDLLVAIVQPKTGALTTQASMTTVPAGWNWIRNDNTAAGSSACSFLYWKIAVGGDASSTPTWGSATSVISYVTIARITGHDPTTPINANNGDIDPSSTTNHLCPTVTTTLPDTLILVTLFASGSTTGTVVSPLVEAWDATTGGGSTRWTYGATQPIAAIGATGTFTVTSAGLTVSPRQTIAIASPAAATSLIIPTETAYSILSRR